MLKKNEAQLKEYWVASLTRRHESEWVLALTPLSLCFLDQRESTVCIRNPDYEWLLSGRPRTGFHSARVSQHWTEERREGYTCHYPQLGGVPASTSLPLVLATQAVGAGPAWRPALETAEGRHLWQWNTGLKCSLFRGRPWWKPLLLFALERACI